MNKPVQTPGRALQVRIEGVELPGAFCDPSPESGDGHRHVHVGIQPRNRRGELLGLVPGDAPAATWTIDCVASPTGLDLTGPYIQGPPQRRFIYLSWGTVSRGELTMFRRAKVWLDTIPPAVMDAAVIVGRLGLTDACGQPLCGSVRPPLIQWSRGDRTVSPR